MRGRATHSSNARRPGTPAGKASTYPARAKGTQGVEASLSSPWCPTRMRPQRPPSTSPGRGPHFQDPGDPPATGKGGSATPGPVTPPDPPLLRNGSTRGRTKGPAIHAGPTTKPMTAGVLWNTAMDQIWALALGKRGQPVIRTETGARAAHTALVHEIFSTLRSALVRRVRNPQDPEPHPATGPAAAAHTHTRATRVQRRPCAREETTGRLRGRLLPPGGRPMDVTPTTAHSAINHDDPGPANPAQKDPLYNATAHGRVTHPSNTCRSDTPTGTTSTCPTPATDTRRVVASLSSPWCRARTKTKRLPPTSPGPGPRFPDPRNPPATANEAAPRPDVLPPHPPLPRAGSTRDQAKGQAKHAGPTAGPMTTRMLTNNRPQYYHPRRAFRGTCTAGTGAHLLLERYTPGTPGGLRHI